MKTKEMDYVEVRNDYFDESDGFYRIDAWESDEDEGEVVAYVHGKSGDAVITAPKAHLSRKVKEAIEQLQDQIRRGPEENENTCFVRIALKDARYETVIPKGTVDEMKQAAVAAYYDADFGDLYECEIDEIVYIQDHEGNFLYETDR